MGFLRLVALFLHDRYLTRNGGDRPLKEITVTDLNSPEERAILEDLSIGTNGKPATHETAALLRMYRNGWTGPQISEVTKLSQPRVVSQLRTALSQEGEAARAGREIVGVSASPSQIVRARQIVVGDELVAEGGAVISIRRMLTDFVFVLNGGREVRHTALDEVLIRRAKVF